MSQFGEYLKYLRKKQGLTLKEVYSQTGISDSRLDRMEKDLRNWKTLCVIYSC